MNVVVGDRWKPFLDAAVREGGYASEEDVVSEGLRLVQERERKLTDLRAMIDASIAKGGSYTIEEVEDFLEQSRRERDTNRQRAA